MRALFSLILTLPFLVPFVAPFVVAQAVTADPLLTGPGFASHTTGRTITFVTRSGIPAGTEQYLPGKRVLWHAKGTDICKTGRWYEHRFSDGPAICFIYDGDPIPVCWYMTRLDQQLTVRQVTAPDNVLIESPIAAELPCTSPYLGS